MFLAFIDNQSGDVLINFVLIKKKECTLVIVVVVDVNVVAVALLVFTDHIMFSCV